MGRRMGFFAAIARDAARAQRQAERQAELQRRMERRSRIEAERFDRQMERETRRAEKEAKQDYIEQRTEETQEKNEELADRLDELKSILQHTLEVDDTISFNSLKLEEKYKKLIPEKLNPRNQPTKDYYLTQVKRPNWFMILFPWIKNKYEKRLAHLEELYHNDVIVYKINEDKIKKENENLKLEFRTSSGAKIS
jgi:restriction system protein